MMRGTSFHRHSLPCKHCMQMNLISSCQESIMEDTGAYKIRFFLTLVERDDFFFPYGESPQWWMWLDFFDFRCLLIGCFYCIIHHWNRNLMKIKRMLSDGRRYGVVVPYRRFWWRGIQICLVSSRRFVFFRCLLTKCFYCIIHQWNRNLMQIKIMLLGGSWYGVAVP